MAIIGSMNRLKVVKIKDFGAFLASELLDDILLPRRFMPEQCRIGDELEVFIYLDSDSLPVATTLKPKAQVNQFACLKVTDTNRMGAFLDWNMPKDLLVPFSEQKEKMVTGQFYVVYIFQEKQNYRLVASSKIGKFLNNTPHSYKNGQPVQLMIADETDIGYTAIIEEQYMGVLFHQEIQSPVRKGMKLNGFIKRVRPDNKLDLSLRKPGYNKDAIHSLETIILAKLKESGGFLPLNDHTPPDTIKKIFGISKRTFKMALGGLYKKRLIVLVKNGIRQQVNEQA